MKHRRYILLFFVVMKLTACERESGSNATTALPETDRLTTGFADYDWVPKKLKHSMEHLAKAYPERHFNFYYYFTVDDINRHFYITDPGLQVVEEMPVTNEDALRTIEDHLYNVKSRMRGSYVAWDTVNWQKYGEKRNQWPYYRGNIFYVLPEDSADFRQLRIAIMEDTAVQHPNRYYGPHDLNVYSPQEVEKPPQPVRGMDYFREAIMSRIASAEVFTLFDTGTVEVEFNVWANTTHSPNLVRGFSTHSDTHEAYQADGEFIKAINDAKVWWRDAQKDGKPVRSKVRMTFDIGTLKN